MPAITPMGRSCRGGPMPLLQKRGAKDQLRAATNSRNSSALTR
jgi:hypothetical protein